MFVLCARPLAVEVGAALAPIEVATGPAWIDQLASGRSAGRGLLISGNHAQGGADRPVRRLPFRPRRFHRPSMDSRLLTGYPRRLKGRQVDSVIPEPIRPPVLLPEPRRLPELLRLPALCRLRPPG